MKYFKTILFFDKTSGERFTCLPLALVTTNQTI